MDNKNEKYTFKVDFEIVGVKYNKSKIDGEVLEYYTALAIVGGHKLHLKIDQRIHDRFKARTLQTGDIWIPDKTKLVSDDDEDFF